LNALTGETGAGKSILVDGLLLALGERADHSLVRPGARTASVEALFLLGGGQEMTVRREISSAGRSRLLIDDEVFSLEDGRARIADLVDLHTQRSTPALMSRRFQQACLDEYAGATAVASSVRDLVRELQGIEGRMVELRRELDSGSPALEMLMHEEKLLGELGASRDEYGDLLERRRLLEKAEAVDRLFGHALAVLSGEEGGLLTAISALRSFLMKSGEDAGDIPDLLETAGIALREASSRCSARLSSIEGAPWMLEQIDERLDRYARLLGRYGGDIDRLLARMQEVSAAIEERASTERKLEEMAGEREKVLRTLTVSVPELTGLRLRGREPLVCSVSSELARLGMPDAVFAVEFREAPGERSVRAGDLRVCSDGAELPEFVFSANPGLPPGPISSVASGGELSRLSLAIRLALSDSSGNATLVFDEIDSGVGGETAGLLADSLSRASLGRQTVVITHLPQIASRALHHLAVSKTVDSGMPVTSVRPLEGESRIEEIARMLGGGSAAVEHARSMLEKAGPER